MQGTAFSCDVARVSLLASKAAAWSFVRALVSSFVVSHAVPTGMTCVFYDCIGRAASPAQIPGSQGPFPLSKAAWHHRSRPKLPRRILSERGDKDSAHSIHR